MVKKLLWKVHQNEADAEDIVQEAYTRSIKYCNAFEQGKDFDKWFSAILYNSFRDWKKEQFHSNDVEEFSEHHVEPIGEPDVKKDTLDAVIYEIPFVENEEHREVLRLHFIQGLRLMEVVQITNLKYKTVDQIVQRFQNKMKEKHEE